MTSKDKLAINNILTEMYDDDDEAGDYNPKVDENIRKELNKLKYERDDLMLKVYGLSDEIERLEKSRPKRPEGPIGYGIHSDFE